MSDRYRIVRSIDVIFPWFLGAVIVFMLASWIPHYLTWPFFMDPETFATLAVGWERGVRPHRDVISYNFPGQTYVFWLLGKAFGWGRSWTFYAWDAGLLLVLCGTLLHWSRRRLGGAVPGLIGILAVLVAYMNLDILLVAQRDWHSTVFAFLAILAYQSTSSRIRFPLSALLMAIASTFRPHVVFFLPSMYFAIVCEMTDDERARWPAVAGRLMLWSLTCGLLSVACFLPLISQGLLDDLVRALPLVRHGGSYAATTFEFAVVLFLSKFMLREYVLLPVAILALACREGGASLRLAAPWLVTLPFAMVYQSVHPLNHFYLLLPMFLSFAVNLAIFASLVRKSFDERPTYAALAMPLVAVLAFDKVPDFCRPSESVRAVREILRGELPAVTPAGARKHFHDQPVDTKDIDSGYRWQDYTAALDYLRSNTDRDTQVAGAFKRYPFPAVNGPIDRVSPWPGECGIGFIRVLGLDAESKFVEALKKAENSVVVWVPGETPSADRLRTTALDAYIREAYEHEKTFGDIEIWRRRRSTQ